jgi:hypothetical protein
MANDGAEGFGCPAVCAQAEAWLQIKPELSGEV